MPNLKDRLIRRNSRPTIDPTQARTSPTRGRTWIDHHCPGTPWIALDDRECHFDAGYVNVFLLPDMYEGRVGWDDEQIELFTQRLLGHY